MSHDSPQLDVFSAELQRLGKDFVCDTVLPANTAIIFFIGKFHDQSVLWLMTLATLSYWREVDGDGLSVADRIAIKHPFIEIVGGKQDVFQIKVGLSLEQIDEPAIRKTIIMIRNYKRLAVGRSGFGNV